jgi:hypothetical protein
LDPFPPPLPSSSSSTHSPPPWSLSVISPPPAPMIRHAWSACIASKAHMLHADFGSLDLLLCAILHSPHTPSQSPPTFSLLHASISTCVTRTTTIDDRSPGFFYIPPRHLFLFYLIATGASFLARRGLEKRHPLCINRQTPPSLDFTKTRLAFLIPHPLVVSRGNFLGLGFSPSPRHVFFRP